MVNFIPIGQPTRIDERTRTLVLGAAAIYAACSLTNTEGVTDVTAMHVLKMMAAEILVTSGVNPTKLKTMGIALIAEAKNIS